MVGFKLSFLKKKIVTITNYWYSYFSLFQISITLVVVTGH